MSQKETTVRDLQRVAARDGRYATDAYAFIYEALAYTVNHLGRSGHVSGRELLEGVRQLALEQFGGLTGMVFARWGVHRTDDFGEIVFTLVEAGLMGKTDEDSRDEFRAVYDFHEAFRFDVVASGAPAGRKK